MVDPHTKRSAGKKGALEQGIAHAGNEWLLHTDDDCIVSEKWVSGMARYIGRGKKIVLGYSPLARRPGLLQALMRFDNVMIAMLYLGSALRGKPYMGVGRNLLYSKSIFEKVGGFESHRDLASGDDDLFVQQAATGRNTAVALDPDTFVTTEPADSFGAFIHQKRRHASTGQRYSSRTKRSLVLYNGSFVIFWVFLLPVLAMKAIIPLGIAALGLVLQWTAFGLVASRLRSASMAVAVLYPFWAILYALFLCAMGIFAITKPPRQWRS